MSEKLNDVRSEYYSIGEFGGQERFVHYDLNAFAEMERIYGSMDAANEALSKGAMTDIRRMLWIGLIHDQAILDEITGEPIRYNLTMFQVGQWITPNNMKNVMEKLSAAINGATPKEEAAAITPAQAQQEAEEAEAGKIVPMAKTTTALNPANPN